MKSLSILWNKCLHFYILVYRITLFIILLKVQKCIDRLELKIKNKIIQLKISLLKIAYVHVQERLSSAF